MREVMNAKTPSGKNDPPAYENSDSCKQKKQKVNDTPTWFSQPETPVQKGKRPGTLGIKKLNSTVKKK
jgi:hypothetical protein